MQYKVTSFFRFRIESGIGPLIFVSEAQLDKVENVATLRNQASSSIGRGVSVQGGEVPHRSNVRWQGPSEFGVLGEISEEKFK